MLTRFAGMSAQVSTMGIYGYDPSLDRESLTAKQISQMLWYFIDGRFKGLKESPLEDLQNFNEFHFVLGEIDTVFLQSKKTNRWWMKVAKGTFIPCSQKDYVTASYNEIPERWMRAQEREF